MLKKNKAKNAMLGFEPSTPKLFSFTLAQWSTIFTELSWKQQIVMIENNMYTIIETVLLVYNYQNMLWCHFNLICGLIMCCCSVHVFELSIRPSLNCVRSISPILFEVGIPNSMCGYTLGSRSVAYYFQVTVILTSGLSSRKIVSGAYLQCYLM